MAFVLPATEYDSIRDVLGLSSTELPSATIERTPFLPSAEAVIKGRVTNYAAIAAVDDSNRVHLYGAIIYLAAALLCDRSKNLFRPADKVGDFTAGQVDWAALKATCLAEYESHIGSISTQSQPEVTLMTLAGIGRTVKARRQLDEGTLDEDLDFENI